MGVKLLEIDATAIKFICEVKKQSTTSVHLTNISDEYVAFKVKTTSPKRFCVRPNSGVISPKSECDFTVTMQGLRSAPSEVECKDKFLIQSTVVDSETKEEDVTLELFSKSSGKYVEEKKLRVILISKQDSPSGEQKNKELAKELFIEASDKEENVVQMEEIVEKKEEIVEKKEEIVAKKEEIVAKKEENVAKKDENVAKKEEIVAKKEEEVAKKEEELAKKEENVTKKEEKAAKKEEKAAKKEEKAAKKEEKVAKKEEKVAKKEEKVAKKEEKVAKKEEILAKKEENLAKKEENVVKKEEEIVAKKDENAPPVHTQIKETKEVKETLTTEESKPSNDPDGNVPNSSKNLKFNPVKIVKDDPIRKLRLCNQLKELKLKESLLEKHLEEAKTTISNLTYQNKIIMEAKETLQKELARKTKKGCPFAIVCLVSLIGLISGYISDPSTTI